MATRRDLLYALGAGALATRLSFAQHQGKTWRVGFLGPRRIKLDDSDYYYRSFRQGMRDLGYVDGNNLVIEWRSAEGENERLPKLAAELATIKVDVIIAAGTPATRAAQKATDTIPIVMGAVGDPVGSGFVKSLTRPAGNITGTSSIAADLRVKQIEMLQSMVPKLSHLAALLNSSNSDHIRSLEVVEAVAQKRGIKVLRTDVRTPLEIDKGFSWMSQQNVGAVIVFLESLFQQQRHQIADLSIKYRLPSMAQDEMYTNAGVLMSYGPSLSGIFRRTAYFVDRIFKGAKPADLPVEQPMIFDLVINSKTARALDLTIPPALQISATKVIE